MELEQFAYWIGIAATVAFSVTAVLAISDRGVDLFGAITLGFITAVGGGTIRDIILDVPVFWSIDLSYIWVGVGSSVAAFFARPLFARKHIYSLLLYLDGFGAALFAVQGAHKTLDTLTRTGRGAPCGSVIRPNQRAKYIDSHGAARTFH